MANPASANPEAAAQAKVEEKNLLDQIVEQGRFGADVQARDRGKNLVKEFIAQVLDGSMTVAKDAEMMINARIAQIDHLLSIQLNEVIHHPAFQKLEGTWRGMKYLVFNSETSNTLKIRALNASKEVLAKDLEKAGENVVPPKFRPFRTILATALKRPPRIFCLIFPSLTIRYDVHRALCFLNLIVCCVPLRTSFLLLPRLPSRFHSHLRLFAWISWTRLHRNRARHRYR